MKQNIAALIVMTVILVMAPVVQAQDFYAVSPSGHRLYYGITSATEHTVSVVSPIQYEDATFYNSQFWGHDVDLIIPDTVYNGGIAYLVTSISTEALNVPMHSLTIPRSMRTVGYHAFASPGSNNSYSVKNNTMRILYFNADSLEYSGGLWTAYNYWMPAFKDCTQLDTVYIGEHVNYLPKVLFSGCDSLRCVVMGDSVHTVDSGAFSNCFRLDSVRVSPALRRLGSSALEHCAIHSIGLPDGLRTIGAGAFTHCESLEKLTMPHTVDSIGHDCFADCHSLQRVHLSNSLTHLPQESFLYCYALTDVDFGTGLRVIGESAFYQCQSLRSIVLPALLDTMEYMCFSVCPIETVTLHATVPPVIVNRAFSTSQSNATPIFIPCGTLDAYQASDSWNSFTNMIESTGYTLVLSVNDTSMGDAEVITPGTCTDPAVITASPNEGFQFVGWNDGDTVNPRTVHLTGDTSFTAIFAVDTTTEGIGDIASDGVVIHVVDRCIIVSGTTRPVNIYDIMGRQVQPNLPLKPGIYLVRIGTSAARKIVVF